MRTPGKEHMMIDYYESEIELVGSVGVLALTGETDLLTAPRFRCDLDEAMEIGTGDVILDLTDVEMLDSTALGIILKATRRLRTEDRALLLVVSRRHVLRVLAATGLAAFLPILPTRSEALEEAAYYGQGPARVA